MFISIRYYYAFDNQVTADEVFANFPIDKTGWKIQITDLRDTRYLIKECPEYFVSYLILKGIIITDETEEVVIYDKDTIDVINGQAVGFNYNLEELEDWEG